MFTGFYTTTKGYQYISKSLTGKTLVLTRGQYGSGKIADGTDIASMTALVTPIADMPISNQHTVNNCVTTTTQFSNKVSGHILTPFYLMEAGVFGKLKNADGTDSEDGPEALLFYACETTQEKADYIPAVLTEFILNWPLTISGSENITIELSESLVYPTLAQFNERAPIKVTAGGTASSLEVEVENIPLRDSLNLLVTLTNDLGDYPGIIYNGGEEYPLYNSNGTEIKTGQQIAGSSLNAIFNAEKQCWYLVGGGSAAGQGIRTMTYAEWEAWKESDEYDPELIVGIIDDYVDPTGKENSTTVFNADGSITKTYTDGRVTITVFNADGSIVETTTKDNVVMVTKTTTFNEDGSITEVEE